MKLKGVRRVRVTTGDLGGLFLVVTSETKARGTNNGVECHRMKVGNECKLEHTGPLDPVATMDSMWDEGWWG